MKREARQKNDEFCKIGQLEDRLAKLNLGEKAHLSEISTLKNTLRLLGDERKQLHNLLDGFRVSGGPTLDSAFCEPPVKRLKEFTERIRSVERMIKDLFEAVGDMKIKPKSHHRLVEVFLKEMSRTLYGKD